MEGTVCKRKDGRWVGAIYVPTDNGKRKRKYVYGKTRKETRIKLNKLIYEVENGLFKQTNETTLVSLMNEWYSIHSKKVANTTAELYRMYIDKHISPKLGKLKLKEITPLILDKFYVEKLETLSPNSVKKLHKFLKQVLGYAQKNNIITTNPTNNVNPPKVKKYKPKIFTEKDFEKLFISVTGTFDELPIMLAGCLGMRRGEIFGLRWNDIDFDNTTITIDNTLVRYSQYLEKDPKSEASKRTIMVPSFIILRLQEYYNSLTAVIDSDKVCTKYKPGYYSQRFPKLLDKFGLPHIRFHDLRHYNAIIMLKYGISDKVGSARLGHSETVLKSTYQHILNEMEQEASDTLSEAFEKIAKK